MLERAIDDVAEDEELGVRVCTKARGGLDAVFVDDAQRAEGLVSRVVVRREGKSVEGVEPIVVGVAAGGPGTLGDFHGGRSCCGHTAEGLLGQDGAKRVLEGC